MNEAKHISALVGLLAGVAAALLWASAQTPNMFSFLMVAGASLPVLIAGIGWSNLTSLVCVVTATALIGFFTAPLAGLGALLTSFAPAAWIAHLSNLSRPAEELGGPNDALAWYPLSDILVHLCLAMSGALIAMGYMIGYGPELANHLVDSIITVMGEANPELDPGADAIATTKALFVNILPLVQGALWVLILFAVFYVALAIVRISSRARRPRDDFPTQLRMPPMGLGGLFCGIALTFAPGPINLIGWVVTGAFSAGFILAGYAIMHERTRGKPARGPILLLSYLLTLAFTLPVLIFLVLGLSATARNMSLTPRDPNP